MLEVPIHDRPKEWKEHDPEFVVAYHVAEQDVVDYLGMVALKRATREHDPSDRLLMTLLRARGLNVAQDGTVTIVYVNDWQSSGDDVEVAGQHGGEA
jgi:hypothetical protein